ncbi:hypothetical protein NA57DRAFT_76828 [Rhizodiscina lignyota]|uniref:Uncharacterized protein n=1 Tax=Rhizodiscina lignyota TaxID=1504668 RepID=A0A9P4IA33_9PEZI|nr:hypothetical protein NA57DRAFT_76828 [Rhizodiscina lignyota]
MAGDKEQAHVPTGENQEEEKPKGFFSPIGDPLGKGLNTVLSPVGAGLGVVTKPLGNVVGGITKPALNPIAGENDQRAEVLGGGNKDSYVHGKQSLGKQEQTADNPLGLDQTGKWGFRDE